MKYHYVYIIYRTDYYLDNCFSPYLYIGVRSCNCLPEEDDYMGSSKLLTAEIENGINSYSKRIISTHNNRADAVNMEIKLHSFANVKADDRYYNRANQTSNKFDISGIKFPPEFSNRVKEGLSKEVSISCEWCGYIGRSAIVKQHHGEYCKDNPNRVEKKKRKAATKNIVCEWCNKECTSQDYKQNHGEVCKANPAPNLIRLREKKATNEKRRQTLIERNNNI